VQNADGAIVTITDVLPSINVTKTASPTSVWEPGGTVTFSLFIENLSTVEGFIIQGGQADSGGGIYDCGRYLC